MRSRGLVHKTHSNSQSNFLLIIRAFRSCLWEAVRECRAVFRDLNADNSLQRALDLLLTTARHSSGGACNSIWGMWHAVRS